MARTQFVVPQFLDVEAKIIGPITARQFIIMLATILTEFLIYRIFLNLLVIIVLGIPVLLIGLAFAFGKVNGQPFHYIVINVIQTIRKPARRVWDKTLTDSDLKVYLQKDVVAVADKVPFKAPLEQSRLSELALVVNTGGVYQADDEQLP